MRLILCSDLYICLTYTLENKVKQFSLYLCTRSHISVVLRTAYRIYIIVFLLVFVCFPQSHVHCRLLWSIWLQVVVLCCVSECSPLEIMQEIHVSVWFGSCQVINTEQVKNVQIFYIFCEISNRLHTVFQWILATHLALYVKLLVILTFFLNKSDWLERRNFSVMSPYLFTISTQAIFCSTFNFMAFWNQRKNK